MWLVRTLERHHDLDLTAVVHCRAGMAEDYCYVMRWYSQKHERIPCWEGGRLLENQQNWYLAMSHEHRAGLELSSEECGEWP